MRSYSVMIEEHAWSSKEASPNNHACRCMVNLGAQEMGEGYQVRFRADNGNLVDGGWPTSTMVRVPAWIQKGGSKGTFYCCHIRITGSHLIHCHHRHLHPSLRWGRQRIRRLGFTARSDPCTQNLFRAASLCISRTSFCRIAASSCRPAASS